MTDIRSNLSQSNSDKTWRQDPDIGPKALEVAKALCSLARERMGTYTYEYAGYQRVVVERGLDRGITACFQTSKPEESTEGPWEDEDPRHYAHRMGNPDV